MSKRKNKIFVGSLWLLAVTTLLLGLSACGGTKASPLPQPEETPARIQVSSGSEESSEAAGKETVSEQQETQSENPVPSESVKQVSAEVQVVNPMNQVSSSKDFESIGIYLALPEEDSWVETESFYIIDGKVVEINFYDKRSQSLASVRAAEEDLSDVSGIYYKFNEDTRVQWTVKTAGGDEIDISMKVMVDGSDIHGALAEWNYQGKNYFLWEEDGRKQPEAVKELAAAIALESGKE